MQACTGLVITVSFVDNPECCDGECEAFLGNLLANRFMMNQPEHSCVSGIPPEGVAQQPILVATCHVHWDPEFCDVKLIQTMILMSELKKIIDDTQMSLRPGSTTTPDCNSIPLILCGDLNSLPESGQTGLHGAR